ncbi:MAG TPA: hypothetical protein EYP14_07810, partial [Planctomycetaceae bacterium]|nr:hypothetical protein [Planctomycetaceae bacterium]
MNEFLDIFRTEANERLERLASGLLALEQASAGEDLIADLFREAHSLKGAAAVTGLDRVAAVCHHMEDVLSKIRDGRMRPDAQVVDALLAATDAVRGLIDEAPADSSELGHHIEQTVRQLQELVDRARADRSETADDADSSEVQPSLATRP